MGREIRRVPEDWEHPRYTQEDAPGSYRVGEYRPLHDEDYETAAEAWEAGYMLWRVGRHKAQPSEHCKHFWEYEQPPDEDTCRSRKWSEAEATHLQMYETVSEGTPVSPVCATKEELVEFLVQNGEFYSSVLWARRVAEAFVEAGWAPTLVGVQTATGAGLRTPREGQFD